MVLLTLGACAAWVPPASADHSMETIVQDDALLLDRSDAQVASSMAALAAMGVARVRLTASWSLIAPEPESPEAPPFNAADPDAYPAQSWYALDRAVRDATADGLSVDIDIAFWAPRWATADTSDPHPRTYIDPTAYARFAQAVALRYSGSFVPAAEVRDSPPSSPAVPPFAGILGALTKQHPTEAQAQAPLQGPLPRVDMFTIWNEPNFGGFLEPQWVLDDGVWQPESPQIYRRLVYAAYPAIKQVNPQATVLVGGTASTGAAPGGNAMAPLEFIRQLACVDRALRPLSTPACIGFKPIPGDGWAQHAYAFDGPPWRQTANPDDATISELPRLTRLLNRLVGLGRLSPALATVWITEFGYPTDSRLTWKPLNQLQQARYLAWAEYRAWSTPHVASFAQFLLQDVPGFQTGLYDQDGRPKLAAQTFATPLWAQSRRPSRYHARSARVTAATTVWIHVRSAHAPTPVRILRQAADGSWEPTSGRVLWGEPRGEQTTQFETDAHGYLLIRVPVPGGTALRSDLEADGEWLQGTPTMAQLMSTPATQHSARRRARRRALRRGRGTRHEICRRPGGQRCLA
jgi:hypothetical protein